MQTVHAPKKLHQHLYFQVLTAITIGILLGHFYPETAVEMKPLGDGFIKLIKMIIAPIIFCTVVTGIAGMQELDKVGRVGVKALLYFEVVSTLALIIGLCVVHVIQPGAGMNIDASTLDTQGLTAYTAAAKAQSTVDFLLNIIPASVVDAFAKGDILQVLLFSLLFGFSLAAMRETGAQVVVFISKISQRAVRHRGDHYEAGADRSLWRHGVHYRQIRRCVAGAAGELNGQLLSYLSAVHLRGTGNHRQVCGFQHHQIHRLYQGRAVYRARHLVLGIGAAAHHDQTGKTGLLQVRSRSGYSYRLFIQS